MAKGQGLGSRDQGLFQLCRDFGQAASSLSTSVSLSLNGDNFLSHAGVGCSRLNVWKTV